MSDNPRDGGQPPDQRQQIHYDYEAIPVKGFATPPWPPEVHPAAPLVPSSPVGPPTPPDTNPPVGYPVPGQPSHRPTQSRHLHPAAWLAIFVALVSVTVVVTVLVTRAITLSTAPTQTVIVSAPAPLTTTSAVAPTTIIPLPPGTPNSPSSGPPTPGLTKAATRIPFTIGKPRSVYNYVDLDIPQGDLDEGDIDYYLAIGVEASDGKMGKASDIEPPSAAECAQLARTRAVTTVRLKDMDPGKTALCVITDKDNVAWLRFIKASGSSQFSDLEFEMTLWKAPE